MSGSTVKAAQGCGSWCLHLLAPMVPIPSGIAATLYCIRSNVPAMLCVCASALQCCSGVAAGHTGLLSAFTCVHHAMLASDTLQLPIRCYLCLPRSLQSQPISCRRSFYLPSRPRTGGGAEFSLDFFSFWGWNGSVREPSSATFKLLGADKQVTDSHSMSSQHRHCPCIPMSLPCSKQPCQGGDLKPVPAGRCQHLHHVSQ